jgi:NAD(P)H dehydrogenase (quinone)
MYQNLLHIIGVERMQKINVMGASGQLGQEVLKKLLDQGVQPQDIIASVRTPEKLNQFMEMGIEVRKADYEDPDSLKSAYANTETLLLIPSTAAVEPRILQHHNALQAAESTGVKRVVFSSLATAAYENSKFHVTPFLRYAELKLRLSGMEWTILRNNMYLDPIASWIPELVEMGHLPYPVKQGRVAYISREDIAWATAAALLQSGHSGKVYELSGSSAISIPELAEVISQVSGSTIRFLNPTEADYIEVCRTGEEAISDLMIWFLVSIYRAVDNREFERVSDHVEILTGTPPESIEAYLQRMLPMVQNIQVEL